MGGRACKGSPQPIPGSRGPHALFAISNGALLFLASCSLVTHYTLTVPCLWVDTGPDLAVTVWCAPDCRQHPQVCKKETWKLSLTQSILQHEFRHTWNTNVLPKLYSCILHKNVPAFWPFLSYICNSIKIFLHKLTITPPNWAVRLLQ